MNGPARFTIEAVGWHEYAVLGWVDRFKTWRRDLQIKAAPGRTSPSSCSKASLMIREAASRATAVSADSDSMRLLECDRRD